MTRSADCTVTDAGYAAMTALVRDLGAELGAPVGCVLEGGYDVDVLARCVAVTMETLASAGPAGSEPGCVDTGARPGAPARRRGDRATVAAVAGYVAVRTLSSQP